MCKSVILKKQIWAVFLSVVGIGTTIFFSTSLFGLGALNVGLSRFEAIPTENGVQLEWDVETEIGTAGYTIKRGEGGNLDYLLDPQGDGTLFILAEGGPAQAYSYSFVDESAIFDSTYTYQLIEITAGSSEQVQDEVTITYHIEATNTPVTFSGDIGSAQENNAATATPAPTQPATAITSEPSLATVAPPPTVSAPTPLPVNTPEKPAADLPDASLDPLSTVTTQQEAYPGDAPVVSETQNDPTRDGSPTSPDNGQPAAASEETAVTGPVAGALSTIAYPDQVNALDAPAGDQQALSPGNSSPVVIGGATATPLESLQGQTKEQIEYQEPVNADSTRILLWLAFLVALLIFTASVVGSILLYNKQRSAN